MDSFVLKSNRRSVKSHVQEVRIGAGGYATIAEAIAYVETLVTLNTKNRVRLMIDNGSYNEAFQIPQFCDVQGESRTGVNLIYNNGDNIFCNEFWSGRKGFVGMYSCSLLRDLTITCHEESAGVGGVNLVGLMPRYGENNVTGIVDNVELDCAKTVGAIGSSSYERTSFETTDAYISMHVKNSNIVGGGNNAVGFGSNADAFIGSLVFIDTDITSGEQLQQPSPIFGTIGFTEYWAVFFGNSFSYTSHNLKPECNFVRCNVKQYDSSFNDRGMQAFNLEFSRFTGAQTSCIDSNFETVKAEPLTNTHHGTPLFVTSYDAKDLINNPNVTFTCFTDGCTFTKNATFTPSGDIRWSSSTQKEPPIITWGGTGTNPILVDTTGNP